MGYIPFLGRKMNKTITALAKHHGDVFQLSIGTTKVVPLSTVSERYGKHS